MDQVSTKTPTEPELPWQQRLPGWALCLGLVLGIIPAWLQWGKMDAWTLIFRACFLPFLGAILLWSISLGATWLFRQSQRGWIQAELSFWPRIIMRRWVWWLLAAILALGAGYSQIRLDSAQRDLQAFFVENAEPGKAGLRVFRYEGIDWTNIPTQSLILPSIDLDSKKDSWFKGIIFNLRNLALVKVARPGRYELGVESDDGALVLLNGQRLINNLGYHAASTKFETLHLEPGLHTLEVLFHQERGDARLRLILPPELAGSLTPLAAKLDRHILWHLNREVEWWTNRRPMLLALALILMGLIILPRPRAWDLAWRQGLKKHWPKLLITGSVGSIMCLGLDSIPGFGGDPAHFGLSAWEWHWKALRPPPWSAHVTQELLIYPAYWLQQVLPLRIWVLRLEPLLLNLAGLLLMGLALERLVSRRAAYLAMILTGTSVWFLFFGRYFVEIHSFAVFSAGAALYGLARAAERWWGVILSAAALALGVWAHGILVVMVMGFGAMLIPALGWRVLKNPRLWLGTAGFGLLVLPWFLNLVNRGMKYATPSNEAGVMLRDNWNALTQVLPSMLSGENLAIFHSGELWLWLPPLAPLLILVLLIAWPWLRPREPYGRALKVTGGFVLVVWLVSAFKTIPTGLELRYLQVPVMGLTLWLALMLAALWNRDEWGGRLAKGFAAAVVLLGLVGYLGNCLYAFSQSGGRYSLVKHVIFASDRKLDYRALYKGLVSQPRRVSFSYWSRRRNS